MHMEGKCLILTIIEPHDYDLSHPRQKVKRSSQKQLFRQVFFFPAFNIPQYIRNIWFRISLGFSENLWQFNKAAFSENYTYSKDWYIYECSVAANAVLLLHLIRLDWDRKPSLKSVWHPAFFFFFSIKKTNKSDKFNHTPEVVAKTCPPFNICSKADKTTCARDIFLFAEKSINCNSFISLL